jgi:hypothetical protein
MLDPYRMVLVNVIVSAILFCGLLFYKYIFPKKNINLFFLLVLISILPIVSIFRTGSYESGDFNIHIYRSMSFYQSLSEGNLMPSWAKDLNATYGYPLFIFNYTLPYYILSFFHFLGFSFILSMKLFLSINLILSGIFIYLFTKTLFKNNFAAFLSSIFYIFATYHLIDLHFKVVIGEILFFTLLPLFFLSIHKLYKKKSAFHICLSSICFAFLILSHPAISIFAGILTFFYILFLMHQDGLRRKPFYMIFSFLFASAISLYSWGAPLFLSQYTGVQIMNYSLPYFPTLSDLLYSPWRIGFLFQGPKGEISNLLGYSQILVICLSVLFIFRNNLNKYRSHFKFWTLAVLILIFLVTPYSKFIWENLPYLKVVGPQRLLVIVAFIISILAGYLVMNIKTRWITYLLVVLTIELTILNWGQRKVISSTNDQSLQQNLPYSTSQGEGHFYANSKWVDIQDPWFSKIPTSHIEIIRGHAAIKIISRTSTAHIYNIYAKTPLQLRENTLYFPGWTAQINNIDISIHPDKQGVISIDAPKGNYVLKLNYNDVSAYKILKLISLTSFLLTSGYIIYILLFKVTYVKK